MAHRRTPPYTIAEQSDIRVTLRPLPLKHDISSHLTLGDLRSNVHNLDRDLSCWARPLEMNTILTSKLNFSMPWTEQRLVPASRVRKRQFLDEIALVAFRLIAE